VSTLNRVPSLSELSAGCYQLLLREAELGIVRDDAVVYVLGDLLSVEDVSDELPIAIANRL